MPVVVKLGSNVVATESGELRADALRGIIDQVAALHAAGDDVVVVTSGAIARGMRLLDLAARPGAMADLQAASAVGQGKLYRHYDELLSAHGITSAQVLLTFGDLSVRTNYLNARQTLRKLIEWRVVPVINENDTTATDEISFGDNDFLAAQVAILLRAKVLVLATDIDALYTADPSVDPSAKPVRMVDDFDLLDRMEIGATASSIGSGGMASKVVAAEMATAAGVPTVICSGVRPGAIARAVAGEPDEGTRFAPHADHVSSFKLWLRYAKPSHGTVAVDAGAERALCERKTSLLPVGIVEVAGEFAAGDAVEIVAAADAGRVIGKGIVNYSASELRSVLGFASDRIQEILPRATAEAVHRDYMVLV